jgi:hypothetical protein
MTRRGWTPALWEATNFALKRITLPKGHRGFALLALAFVDSQYAQKGLGEKLDKIDKQGPALTSWQDIEWRLCIADTIANDLVRFNLTDSP